MSIVSHKMSYLTWAKDDWAAWEWQDQFAGSYSSGERVDFSLESRVLDVSPATPVLNSRATRREPPYPASFVTVPAMPLVRGPLDKHVTS